MSRWWRAYDEALNDPKLQVMGLEMVGAWFNLLCLASKNSGTIRVPDVPFALRLSKNKAAAIITKLAVAGLLDRDGDDYRPHNWDGRQFLSDDSTERVQRYRDRRKASGLPALGDYTKFKPALIERDGERCVYCEATSRLVVDHMVPIALGGTDHEDNLALACKPCNSGKSGRTPELARMSIRVTTAAQALARYRDKHKPVTVTGTPPDTEQIQSRAEQTAGAASSPVAPYAFESGVIRLKQKDFDQWKQAFSHLDVPAELIAMTDWAGQQAKWFVAVSNALNKKNGAMKVKIEQQKTAPAFRWNGMEGVT